MENHVHEWTCLSVVKLSINSMMDLCSIAYLKLVWYHRAYIKRSSSLYTSNYPRFKFNDNFVGF